MEKTKKQGPGRGWHGNPEAHAVAGQKGGIQNGKNWLKKKKGGKNG